MRPESEPSPCDEATLAVVLQQEATAARLKLPVASEQVDISFKDFVALFLQDNAPYSIKRSIFFPIVANYHIYCTA